MLILEPFSEPIPIPELNPETIPETDSGSTIRNRLQKILELAEIHSKQNFMFAINYFESYNGIIQGSSNFSVGGPHCFTNNVVISIIDLFWET